MVVAVSSVMFLIRAMLSSCDPEILLHQQVFAGSTCWLSYLEAGHSLMSSVNEASYSSCCPADGH